MQEGFPESPKGSVLNSRILWSFSAGYHLTGKAEYLRWLKEHLIYLEKFIDRSLGVY
jgi:mannobiose 2-epimerase